MTSPDDSLNRLLKRVGLLPRLIHFGTLIFFTLLGWGSWVAGNPALSIVMVALGLLGFILSLRIRAWMIEDALVVRTYFRTHTIRFDVTTVIGFCDVPYAGLWNRGVGTEYSES